MALRKYNLSKEKDVEDAFWCDNLMGDKSQVLHEMIRLDKLKAKEKENDSSRDRNQTK